jgi:hypothetical protein
VVKRERQSLVLIIIVRKMTGFTWLQFSSFLQLVGSVDVDHEAVSLANHIHGWSKGEL